MSAATDELPHFVAMFPSRAELEWQDRALCAETYPEEFFPLKGGSSQAAKRVCQGCEVRAECLDYALENNERFGIWGGLSERERHFLGRASARPRPVAAVVTRLPVPVLAMAEPEPPERCEVCGYLLTAPGHRAECGAP